MNINRHVHFGDATKGILFTEFIEDIGCGWTNVDVGVQNQYMVVLVEQLKSILFLKDWEIPKFFPTATLAFAMSAEYVGDNA